MISEGIVRLMRATLMEQPTVVEEQQSLLTAESISTGQPDAAELTPKNRFVNRFEDGMAMNADIKTVAQYLDQHQSWFTRCAQPMQVEAISTNGYAITIGRFGSFGYIVEPKVGLELLPQNQGVYRIQTVAIPDYCPPGYEVDFSAEMRLVEVVQADRLLTQVEWSLDLAVAIQFPKFIHKLPPSLIQKTGDKVLQQIVRQVSKRLTQRVQKDFHGVSGLVQPSM